MDNSTNWEMPGDNSTNWETSVDNSTNWGTTVDNSTTWNITEANKGIRLQIYVLIGMNFAFIKNKMNFFLS